MTSKELEYLLKGMHLTNGSPVYLGGQVHMGLCLITSHLASTPHDPAHGLIHFWLLQALFGGQSELTTHSGRHVGGLPMYPGTQVHTACPLTSLHWLFGPQGEGWHGFVTTGTTIRKLFVRIKLILNRYHLKRFCMDKN